MVPVTDQTAISLLPRGMGGWGKFLQLTARKQPDRNFGCFLFAGLWPWPLTYRTTVERLLGVYGRNALIYMCSANTLPGSSVMLPKPRTLGSLSVTNFRLQNVCSKAPPTRHQNIVSQLYRVSELLDCTTPSDKLGL